MPVLHVLLDRKRRICYAAIPMIPADIAWMLTATALVLLMTPALGFFYGGLVRSKNALNTLMMSFTALGFVGIGWAIVGYSLAFAPGGDWAGGLSQALLRGVGLEAHGLHIVKRVPIPIPANRHNRRYLATKRDKLGHLLDLKLGET